MSNLYLRIDGSGWCPEQMWAIGAFLFFKRLARLTSFLSHDAEPAKRKKVLLREKFIPKEWFFGFFLYLCRKSSNRYATESKCFEEPFPDCHPLVWPCRHLLVVQQRRQFCFWTRYGTRDPPSPMVWWLASSQNRKTRAIDLTEGQAPCEADQHLCYQPG